MPAGEVMASRQRIFELIYKHDRWRGPESRSGPGSTRGSTARLQRILPQLVAGLRIESVLDAGAGDSQWMPDLPGYIGVELVPDAIAAVEARFPERAYFTGDICSIHLPRCDAVIIRDVLAHLSNVDALAALKNIRESGATWLFATTFDPADNTTDTLTGRYREYDITRPPYDLGEPWWLIEDGFWEDRVVFANKFFGAWTL
jgi:SAM-dependent methyltransferase